MSEPLRTHKGQRANERAAMRLQLVTAMVTGLDAYVDQEFCEAKIADADAIIDALEARRASEKE